MSFTPSIETMRERFAATEQAYNKELNIQTLDGVRAAMNDKNIQRHLVNVPIHDRYAGDFTRDYSNVLAELQAAGFTVKVESAPSHSNDGRKRLIVSWNKK